MTLPSSPFTERAARQLAEELIENYGDGAELAAADRCEAMRELGRTEVAQLWAEVAEIIARRQGRARRRDA